MPDESVPGAGTRPATPPVEPAATFAAPIVAGSEGEVQEAVREAHDAGTPLRITGRGTWMRGGAPVHQGRRLDLSRLTGIVEYVPGDLTLTARAGTTLAEIRESAAKHGQWLPLDPFGSPDGTLGATLATASTGPLGATIGLPRDLTVGLAFVTGDGQLVHGGGRVVKNVAGFDLVRLTIGAWGTLGAIVEATVRLRAKPDTDLTVGMPLPEDAAALGRLVQAVRRAPVDPLAAELVSPFLAARLALGDAGQLLFRLVGNREAVAHQRNVLATLATAQEIDPDVWTRLQRSDQPDAAIVRISRRPTELVRLWRTATANPEVDAHATLARGVVRLRLPSRPSGGADPLAAFDPADMRIIEQAPPAWRSRTTVPAGARDALSQRLRLAFDPRHILNRGILGDPVP